MEFSEPGVYSAIATHRVPMTTLYDVLGVSTLATPKQIGRAYHTQALQLHPDKGGSPDAFHRLHWAHSVLSNHRQQYDPAQVMIVDRTHKTTTIQRTVVDKATICDRCLGTGLSYIVPNLTSHFRAPHVRCAYCIHGYINVRLSIVRETISLHGPLRFPGKGDQRPGYPPADLIIEMR